MKRHIIYTLIALLAASLPAMAQSSEDDYDESIRMPIRRLHPEREREKARKKLQQELDEKNKASQVADDSAWSVKAPAGSKGNSRRGGGTGKQASSTGDRSLLEDLLNRDYSLKEYVAPAPEPLRWKDTPVAETENELLMKLSKTSVQTGVVRYMPKGVSLATTENEFFAYFTTDGARTGPLHLRIQYYADDPLNFNDVKFVIDGFDYRFRAISPKRGKGSGRMIWEMADQELSRGDKDLIYALSHAQWVRMSLVGADGTKHVKMLTEKQIHDFYCVLQLFRLMGGNIN